MSACLARERSQARNAESCLAALSILRVVLAPQEVHLHRVLPALVLPFLFILAPHRGHVFDFIAEPRLATNFLGRFSMV